MGNVNNAPHRTLYKSYLGYLSEHQSQIKNSKFKWEFMVLILTKKSH